MVDIANTLGLFVGHLSAPARKPARWSADLGDSPAPLFAPPMNALEDECCARSWCDGRLAVVNSLFPVNHHADDTAVYEFGFPAFHRHVVADNPYLGFDGLLSMVSDWVLLMSQRR